MYAEEYIAFVFPFSIPVSLCLYIPSFIRQLLSVALVEFTSKFLDKVSLSDYMSPTTAGGQNL